MLPIRDENAHQTLFSNNKFDRIRHSQTTISLNASTRCERIDVQRRRADVKRGGLYIEIHVQTDGGGQTRIFWKPHGGRRRLVTSTAKFREEIDAGSAQAQLISGNHGWSSDRRTNVDRPTDRFSGLISRSHRPWDILAQRRGKKSTTLMCHRRRSSRRYDQQIPATRDRLIDRSPHHSTRITRRVVVSIRTAPTIKNR